MHGKEQNIHRQNKKSLRSSFISSRNYSIIWAIKISFRLFIQNFSIYWGHPYDKNKFGDAIDSKFYNTKMTDNELLTYQKLSFLAKLKCFSAIVALFWYLRRKVEFYGAHVLEYCHRKHNSFLISLISLT